MSEQQEEQIWLSEIWLELKPRLQRLLASRVPPVLSRRFGLDDLLQECYLSCSRRISFLKAQPEVPMYVKLRIIALQTLTDLERHHLGARKRDAMKECHWDEDKSPAASQEAWERFADTITSPRTHMLKMERYALVRRVLLDLSDKDREIIELRHFEELSNKECAAVLSIEVKSSSIRYVRALKRVQELIVKSQLF